MPESMPIRIAGNAVILRRGSVLLVEFNDESGLHYNFPGGGVEPGETLEEAVCREAREETDLDVTSSGCSWSWNPSHRETRTSSAAGASRGMSCASSSSATPPPTHRPGDPKVHDGNQTGVRWVPTNSLDSVTIFPNVASDLLAAIGHAAVRPMLIANPHDLDPQPANSPPSP
jgi:8-oxo-dGTP diphosphatase